MATPTITPLPLAPSRADGPVLFNQRSDPFIAALPPFALQMNVAVSWMAATMTTVLDYKNAAALSATAAADSATLAGQQVGLAVTARQGAEAAQASTIALAAALVAGALPAFVNGLDVLQVKPDKTGVQWGKVGQAIGDVLETTRTPDATYILPDTIYTRAAYPDLFAIVGTIGEKNDGANFTTVSHGQTSTNEYVKIACGLNDVMVAVGNITSGQSSTTGGTAIRSTDKGLTWAPIPNLIGVNALALVDTDGKGVWVAMSSISTNSYRSSDNGVTWTLINTSGLGANAARSLATDKNGVWIASTADQAATTFTRSLDNGLTWGSIASAGAAGSVSTDGWGTWYCIAGSGTLYRSVNNGTSWAVMFSNTVTGMRVPTSGGDVSIFFAEYKLFISADRGNTWKMFPVSSAVPYIDKDGVIYLQQYGKLYKSYDYGESWVTTAQATVYNYAAMAVDSTGVWVTPNAASTATLLRATRQYNYDISTQFKTPAHKAPKGYKAYIKGKLA